MHYLERYKGNNILCLIRKEGDRFPFSFGVAKARLILDNIDAIKEFVEHEQEFGREDGEDNEQRNPRVC